MFGKYHYLDTSLNPAAQCFGLYEEDRIVGFCAVLHQPNARIRNMKRATRLVILPDYQGIGLGAELMTKVAQYYKDNGFEFYVKTSHKNMIKSWDKSGKWELRSWGFSQPNMKMKGLNKTIRDKCKTASFKYK